MAKPSVTLRGTKASALTYNELDTNFTNLRDATISVTDGANTAVLDLNDLLTVTAGSGITVAVDSGTKTLTITNTGTGAFVTIDTDQTVTGDKTFTGITTLGPYKESVYSIGNSGSSVTPDFENGPVQTITATADFTVAVPSNMTAGSNLTFVITQDGTGGWEWTPNASLKFANSFKTLSSGAGDIDIVTVFYDGTNYLCSLIRNYS